MSGTRGYYERRILVTFHPRGQSPCLLRGPLGGLRWIGEACEVSRLMTSPLMLMAALAIHLVHNLEAHAAHGDIQPMSACRNPTRRGTQGTPNPWMTGGPGRRETTNRAAIVQAGER